MSPVCRGEPPGLGHEEGGIRWGTRYGEVGTPPRRLHPAHFCGRAGTSDARHPGTEGRGGEGLSHQAPGLEVQPGWPERGVRTSAATCASDANADRPRGQAGARCRGRQRSLRLGARVCASEALGDGCPAVPRCDPRAGGGADCGAGGLEAPRIWRAGGSAVRRSAGRAPQGPALPRGPRTGALITTPPWGPSGLLSCRTSFPHP